MPSIAEIELRARDNASDDILRVERSLLRLDSVAGKPITLQASGAASVTNTLRSGEQAATKMGGAVAGLGGNLRSVAGVASSIAGAFGIAFGAQAVVSFAGEAMQAANTFEVTEARVRALAGSQERYNEILAKARAQQATYGGSLNDNLAALGSFVNLSNRTGVPIDTITDAVRRLAAADPAQGIDGATLAIREFMTATGAEAATSLAERFELDRKAVAALATAGASAEQKMAGLLGLLTQQGLTAEFVAASTTTTAQSYVNLQSAWSNLMTAIGSQTASTLEPAAVATTDFLNRLANLGTIESLVTTATGERGAALQALLPRLLAASEGSRANEDAVRNEIAAYYAGSGAYAEAANANALLTQRLYELESARRLDLEAQAVQTFSTLGYAAATDTATTAAQEQAAAQAEETEQAVLNEAQSRLSAQAKDELRGRAEEAAAALLRSGDASAAAMAKMAAQYGVTLELVGAYYQLAQAAQVAAAAQAHQAAMEDYRAQERLTAQGVKVGGALDPAAQERQRTSALAAQAELADKAAKAQAAAAKKTAAANKKAASSASKEAKAAAAAEAKAQREQEAADKAAAREAEQIQKAQDALLTDEEKLAVFRQRLEAGGLPEADRLELVKQIRDLEESISNEQEKQRKAAIDAQLAAIDDRKKRREEAKELAQAQRVLASATTSAEQKAAAQDVLERIPLEQAKRAQEIADKVGDAAGAMAGGAAAPDTLTTMPVGQPAGPVPVTIAQPTLPPFQFASGAAGTSPLTINATIVLPDNTVLGTGSMSTTLGANTITDLRLALRATGA